MSCTDISTSNTKRIGIITHYYNSHNYGGTLQAYALCRFLNNHGYNAEQICFVNHNIDEKRIVAKNSISILLRNFKSKIKKHLKDFKRKKIKRRFSMFIKFQESIPHSKRKYYIDTIRESNSDYDFFITGSDQVWNPDWFATAYFLDFVNDNLKKISYAASIGKSKLNDEQNIIFGSYLSKFKAISVREKSACDLIKRATGRNNVQWVVDPTLLLNKTEWDDIATKRRIKKKYIFCYFFGEDVKSREIALSYAKARDLKIVNIPDLLDYKEVKSDRHFGNYRLYDVSPQDFISLIKFSECVFTNSFHACVFSCIYNKNFFAFNRTDAKDMHDRIYSLCELFECANHFCDDEDKKTIDYVDNLTEIDYKKFFKAFQLIKEQSVAFLKNNLV